MKKFLLLLIALPMLSVVAKEPASRNGGNVIEVRSAEQLESLLKTEVRKKVIKFYSPSCPHCQNVKKLYEQLAAQYPEATFIAIDITQFPRLGAQYRKGTSLPIFVFFDREGNKTGESSGDIAHPALKRKMKDMLGK